MDIRIQKTIDSLNSNHIETFYAETKENIVEIVKSLLKEGDVISCGGSVTLRESGVIDLMRNGAYVFLDRDKEGLSREDINQIYLKSFSCDAYLTSSNAVTQNGELINVDGNGNRVSAMIYGPKKVIYILGANKIVEDIKEGFKRVKTVAAPKNAKRLGTDTPCKTLGHCIFPDADMTEGCDSPDRMCAYYAVTAKQRNKDRIKVIITPEHLGY